MRGRHDVGVRPGASRPVSLGQDARSGSSSIPPDSWTQPLVTQERRQSTTSTLANNITTCFAHFFASSLWRRCLNGPLYELFRSQPPISLLSIGESWELPLFLRLCNALGAVRLADHCASLHGHSPRLCAALGGLGMSYLVPIIIVRPPVVRKRTWTYLHSHVLLLKSTPRSSNVGLRSSSMGRTLRMRR